MNELKGKEWSDIKRMKWIEKIKENGTEFREMKGMMWKNEKEVNGRKWKDGNERNS